MPLWLLYLPAGPGHRLNVIFVALVVGRLHVCSYLPPTVRRSGKIKGHRVRNQLAILKVVHFYNSQNLYCAQNRRVTLLISTQITRTFNFSHITKKLSLPMYQALPPRTSLLPVAFVQNACTCHFVVALSTFLYAHHPYGIC